MILAIFLFFGTGAAINEYQSEQQLHRTELFVCPDYLQCA